MIYIIADSDKFLLQRYETIRHYYSFWRNTSSW